MKLVSNRGSGGIFQFLFLLRSGRNSWSYIFKIIYIYMVCDPYIFWLCGISRGSCVAERLRAAAMQIFYLLIFRGCIYCYCFASHPCCFRRAPSSQRIAVLFSLILGFFFAICYLWRNFFTTGGKIRIFFPLVK